MLTQEQAQGLNIQQHELEDAELQQARAQQEMDRYYDAIKKANDAMQNGTAEQREKIAGLLPRLTEWYNNAKNKRAYEEDRFWVATNKINEYRALDAAQQPTQWGGQRRRTYVSSNQNGARVIPEQVQQMSRNLNYNSPQRVNTSTYIPSWINQPTNNTNNYNIPTNSQISVWVWTTAWFNPIQPIQTTQPTYTTISTPNLATPLEIQAVQRARWNDYLRWMRDLENMWYTVFNQKAYKNGRSRDLVTPLF